MKYRKKPDPRYYIKKAIQYKGGSKEFLSTCPGWVMNALQGKMNPMSTRDDIIFNDYAGVGHIVKENDWFCLFEDGRYELLSSKEFEEHEPSSVSYNDNGTTSEKQDNTRIQYEYLVKEVYKFEPKDWNDLGLAGWKLVTHLNNYCVFIREKE